MMRALASSAIFAGTLFFIAPAEAQNSLEDVDAWTPAQKKTFLLDAAIVDARLIGTGVTDSYRLTLSDGRVSHDAAFQSVEIHKSKAVIKGRTELNFQDSYRFNLAAYELSKLLGISEMMPVTVERAWQNKRGALSWWVKARGDENQRKEKGELPPNPIDWSDEMHRVRVFTELVYDSDRHGGNLLITPEWKLVMIDFSRAFRRGAELQKPQRLTRCDRALASKMTSLREESVVEHLSRYLSHRQIRDVMKRRDALLDHFQEKIQELGEQRVLY